MGSEQLRKLPSFNARRSETAGFYNACLGSIPGLVTPAVGPRRTHAWHQYTLRVTPPFPFSRDQLVDRLIRNAPVICATATGLDESLIHGRIFDLCVMDEASQSTEPAAWIPLLRSDRLVLAGDPFQLPPTVVSVEAAAQGYAAAQDAAR